jgi:hypothetical protein
MAKLILGLCERFGCLPSALLEEDAGLLRLLKIESLGTPEPAAAAFDVGGG